MSDSWQDTELRIRIPAHWPDTLFCDTPALSNVARYPRT
jgi:hypothetical protein